MSRALIAPVFVSLALVAGPVLAQTPGAPSEPLAASQLEAAAEAFGKRMEGFAAQAEAIKADKRLSEDDKEARIEALFAQHQPALAEFTTLAARLGGEIAQAALAEVDIAQITAETMQTAMVPAQGVIANSAWTNPDPDQMVAYGLMADYALGQTADAIDAVHAETERAHDEVVRANAQLAKAPPSAD